MKVDNCDNVALSDHLLTPADPSTGRPFSRADPAEPSRSSERTSCNMCFLSFFLSVKPKAVPVTDMHLINAAQTASGRKERKKE